jgi:hypothetical protein
MIDFALRYHDAIVSLLDLIAFILVTPDLVELFGGFEAGALKMERAFQIVYGLLFLLTVVLAVFSWTFFGANIHDVAVAHGLDRTENAIVLAFASALFLVLAARVLLTALSGISHVAAYFTDRLGIVFLLLGAIVFVSARFFAITVSVIQGWEPSTLPADLA